MCLITREEEEEEMQSITLGGFSSKLWFPPRRSHRLITSSPGGSTAGVLQKVAVVLKNTYRHK
jgi:hypothetical protein